MKNWKSILSLFLCMLMLLPAACHSYARDALPDWLAVQRETLRWLNTYGKEKDR